MPTPHPSLPAGTAPTPGVVHTPSRLPVAETVTGLTEAIESAGATVFLVLDQAAEARAVGLALRDTVLVVFGSPSAGTPVMAASPTAAVDLPLKIVVWADDAGGVWMTTLSGQWLAERHGLPADGARPLGAAAAFVAAVAASTS